MLGISIHQDHCPPSVDQFHSEVEGGSGLAHTALLIADGQYTSLEHMFHPPLHLIIERAACVPPEIGGSLYHLP
jgi:hypothetical protein